MRIQGLSTRAQLLQAAFTEFREQGYRRARLSRILAAAGVTKGALYHHFPDKWALALAVIDQTLAAHIEATWIAPWSLGRDPVAALVVAVRQHFAVLGNETDGSGCPLRQLFADMVALDENFPEDLERALARPRNALIRCLAGARAAGTVRADVDCEAAALFILSSWRGCWDLARNLRSVKAAQACGEELLRYLESLASLPIPAPARTTLGHPMLPASGSL